MQSDFISDSRPDVLWLFAVVALSGDRQTSRWAITRALKATSIKTIKSVGGYGYAINTDKN
jgi:hypothetical protein